VQQPVRELSFVAFSRLFLAALQSCGGTASITRMSIRSEYLELTMMALKERFSPDAAKTTRLCNSSPL
jgi:hypothetical protein